ncbi:MAG TPA: superoxide dismutase, partial [Bacteroidia bacterium]|nr:superoxide dismutase [Bacteroidia bacterium]
METRRNFIRKSFLAGAGITIFGKKLAATTAENFRATILQQQIAPYTLPAMPYPYDALEPHIDRQTMEIHHTKHHQAYVMNLNKALEGLKISLTPLEELLSSVSKYAPAVRNNAGGHWNHTFFWEIMTPDHRASATNAPTGKIGEAINSAFGSFEKFKERFTAAAKDRFG